MKDLVVSSSSLKAYKDCRKMYDLGYERMFDPNATNNAVEQGSSFHKIIAELALGVDGHVPEEGEMLDVALAYVKHRPLPHEIIYVEEPIYTRIDEHTWLRCTFDLVYRDGDEYVGRDYKTFEREPNYDVDLDFQGRIYLSALREHFKSERVRFEYENVRRTPPGVPHNKRGDCWTPEDCYITIPLIIPQHEMDTLWEETRWVIEDIRRTQENGHWYRQDRKGWGGCSSCFYRFLCKAEVQQGELDQQTIDLLSTPREPLKVPE